MEDDFSISHTGGLEEKSRTFDLLFFHHHSHCIFLLSISHNDIPVLAVPEPGLVAD